MIETVRFELPMYNCICLLRIISKQSLEGNYVIDFNMDTGRPMHFETGYFASKIMLILFKCLLCWYEQLSNFVFVFYMWSRGTYIHLHTVFDWSSEMQTSFFLFFSLDMRQNRIATGINLYVS